MARKIMVLAVCLMLVGSALAESFKNKAKITVLDNQKQVSLFTEPSFATAVQCTVRHDYGPFWAIDHWVFGNELYKSFQDPSLTCTGPYPFTVENLFFVVQTQTACTLMVSYDIEAVDWTNPDCPMPGEILTLSATYQMILPSAGLYQIEAPIDSPVTINEPYFAGLFFANQVDSTWGFALVTDSAPTTCANYNIWDTTEGYVDLGNNTYYNFPGRLLFFTSGTPGGNGGVQPDPSITFIAPEYGEKVSGALIIKAVETSGNNIIDYVKFEYRGFGDWHEIATDYEGVSPLRNGIDNAGTGDGWSAVWDYSIMPEDSYWLKATVFDEQGRSDIDSIQISIDPTPPAPEIINPQQFGTICLPITIDVQSNDENITYAKFEKKNGSLDYLLPVSTLNQNNFANYYCGPVAAALAVKYWFDQGFVYCMREGTQYLPLDTVVQRLAENMLTNPNSGTYDDLFLSGFRQYSLTHGNELRISGVDQPDYFAIRTMAQEEEAILIYGLSGNPGLYLVSAGFSGLGDELGRYSATVSDPLTGSIVNVYIRDNESSSEMYYNGVWHKIDILFAVKGYSHTVSRDLLGSDSDFTDGINYLWTNANMADDSLYFLRATLDDESGRSESYATMFIYSCGSAYSKGDYNGDGLVNIGDALYLIDFVYRKGAAPVEGAGRADANCDGNIDISDAIFVIKYLFEGGQSPCY